jgi:ferric-dicitrate binding protein FerR (iron transport regulator)
MGNNVPHIDYEQIATYLSGEGSQEERQVIESWIESSEENRTFFEECRKVFAFDYAEVGEVAKTEKEEQFDTRKAWNNVYAQLEFKDENLDEVDIMLDTALDDIDEELDGTLKEVSRPYPWIRIAAVFVLGLAATFFFINRSANQLVTLAGTEEVNEYYLSDSTKVVLAANASLSYRKNYGRNNREVDLRGKAYFDVVRDEDLPFIISTISGRIEVLGTSFVVEENNDSLYVIVESGKVQMTSLASKESLVLERNEKGILDLDSHQLDKKDLENINELYWANKRITYRQHPLILVFDELAIIFEKDIQYDFEQLENCRITAVFMQQTFEEIIKNMSISMDFEYILEDNRVVITSNGCESE